MSLKLVMDHYWAMDEKYLEKIALIADRQGDISALDGNAKSNQSKTYIRNGLAVITAKGPMFRYANVLTDVSGATSYELLAKEITRVIDDINIKAIVLKINSPGGEVNGADQLGQLIQNSSKPIHAYIDGLGASAGYWLASSADSITADRTSTIGSIGVQCAIQKDDSDKLSFISSQSPMKNKDPSTKEGAAEVQGIIDGLADYFVGAVAEGRGIEKKEVLEKYGQGRCFLAKDALARGMIDNIATFEEFVMGLEGESSKELSPEEFKAAYPDMSAHFFELGKLEGIKIGANEEHKRLTAIEKVAQEAGCSLDFIASLKKDAEMTPEKAALKIVQERAFSSSVPTPQGDAEHLGGHTIKEGTEEYFKQEVARYGV